MRRLAAAAGTMLCASCLLVTGAAAAPAWLASADLSATGADATAPQLAVDAAGDAAVVWQRYDGTSWRVQVSTRPAGGGWSAPQDLSATGGSAMSPAVSLGADGVVVAVWRRYDGAHWIVQASRRAPGGSWTAAENLSPSGQDANFPRVGVDAAGDAIVVWELDLATPTAQGRTRTAGGTWGATHDLSAAGERAFVPELSVGADGTAVAVWQRTGLADTVVRSATRSPGGSWSAAQSLSDVAHAAESPRVTVDARGDATAVWRLYNGSHWITQGVTRPVGSGWGATHTLSAPSEDASGPDVAANSRGDTAAVWVQHVDPSHQLIQSAERSVAGSWSAAQNVTGQYDDDRPRVAVEPQGGATAVWRHWSGTALVVHGATRAATGGWTGVHTVSPPQHDAQDPIIAVDAQGDATATWDHYDGAHWRVQASARDAAGPRLEGLQLPPTGTVGVPLAFGVAPLDTWSGVLATGWDFGDGSSALGAHASHTYASPGAYVVTAISIDAVGNASSVSRLVEVGVPPPPPPPGSPAAPKLSLVRTPASVAYGVRIAARCAGATCRGEVRLTVKERLRCATIIGISANRGRRATCTRTVSVGELRFTIQPGAAKTLTVSLNRTGRSLLTRFRRLPVTVTVGVIEPNGSWRSVAARRLVLKLPRKRR
jgi:hypothetical protein